MFNRNDTQKDVLKDLEIPCKQEIYETSIMQEETKTLSHTLGDSESAVYPLSLEQIYAQEIGERENIAPQQDPTELCFKQEHTVQEKQKTKTKKTLKGIWFLVRYIFTSSTIFIVLLLSANYQAYYSIGYSYFFQGKMIEKQVSLVNSVEAGNISKEENLDSVGEEILGENPHSVSNLVAKAKNQDVNLDITITPYENRIVIPKIGKNIPLIEVEQEKVSGIKELNDIFMQELERGIVRYPGSGKPGKIGNTFIFGHSSNFPWLKGQYNDVFALLDNVEINDEIVVYYEQQKYIYKITEKTVINPDDVGILKRKNDISEITLMTCWPIGTDLERLIVIGELIISE